MRIQFCLCLKDNEYADRICRYLNRQGGEIQAIAVDHEAGLWEADPSAIILTDSGRIKEIPGKAVFFGKASEAEAIRWTKERIEPYQNGSRLYRECLNVAERLIRLETLVQEPMAERRWEYEKPPLVKTDPEKGSVICVYSPCGGIGKTTVALAVCDAIASFGRGRILYLNLEGSSDWRRYYRSKAIYNLSDLLYTMLLEEGRPEAVKEQIEEIVTRQTNGVFFMEPCNDPEDLSVLTDPEAAALFSLLKDSFSWIVCDLNSTFDGIGRRVFGLSDHRILLRSDDERSKEKWEDLRRLLRRQHRLAWIEENSLFLRIEPAGTKVRKKDGTRTLVCEKDLLQEKEGLLGFRRSTEWYQKLTQILKEAGLVHGG